MSNKNPESLIKKIDDLIKKNNELEKKVFNLVHNPEENKSKSFIEKKEKELKELQSQIKQKEAKIAEDENRLKMKEAELNQREMILQKKEDDLFQKELELQKQKAMLKPKPVPIIPKPVPVIPKPVPKPVIKKPVDKKKTINDICSHILNSKAVSPKKLYEDMSVFGTILKKEIEEELKTNPDKFVQIDSEIKNKDSKFFPSAILAKGMEQNNILAVVEKDPNPSPIYDIALQFLVNGMVNEKKLVVSYDFGKEINDLIIYDEKEQKKFVEKELDKFSQMLGVDKRYINICNFREGSCKFDVQISQNLVESLIKESQKQQEIQKPYVDPFLNIDDNFENLVNKLTAISKDAKNTQLKVEPLVEGIKLNTSLFDPRGNRSSGWPIGEKRGGMEYESPIGWIGHGLRVSQKYDNGDDTWLGMDNSEGEWCVAYHGTNIKFAKAILESHLQPGKGQVHQYCKNVNTRCSLEKVGIGIYVSPKVGIGESYSTEVDNYRCMFMCRINPKKFRTCDDTNREYWVVNPSEEDIRPYRLLIKKCE